MVENGSEAGILNLWNAVINQAIIDYSWEPVEMANKPLYREKYNARKTVEWWLGTDDFYDVCRFAQVNASEVLNKFKGIKHGIHTDS